MTDEHKQHPETTPETPPAADETEIPAAEDELQAEVDKLRTEAAEYLEGWQRARAEFSNYRRRVDREREDHRREAAINVLADFLPVLDDLERALGNIPDDVSDHTWAKGITLIGEKFTTVLANHGLEAIDPAGEAFDPTRHEAVGMDNSDDVESGHVTIVLQKGYAYGDKVLRPALVRVAS